MTDRDKKLTSLLPSNTSQLPPDGHSALLLPDPSCHDNQLLTATSGSQQQLLTATSESPQQLLKDAPSSQLLHSSEPRLLQTSLKTQILTVPSNSELLQGDIEVSTFAGNNILVTETVAGMTAEVAAARMTAEVAAAARMTAEDAAAARMAADDSKVLFTDTLETDKIVGEKHKNEIVDEDDSKTAIQVLPPPESSVVPSGTDRRQLLSGSSNDRKKSRDSKQTKYRSLDKSSAFCDILVQALLDLQYTREKYEDGILVLHDIDSESHLELKSKLDAGMKELFEGLKRHMQLQDYLLTKYQHFQQSNRSDSSDSVSRHISDLNTSHNISQLVKIKQEKPTRENDFGVTVKMETDGDCVVDDGEEADGQHEDLLHHEDQHSQHHLPEINDLDDLDLPNEDLDEDLQEKVDENARTENLHILKAATESKVLKGEKKKFECEYCFKGFSVKKHLVVHRRIHTGEAPYECNACDKKFKQISSLNMHKRSHTGEKPYRCDQCVKQYGSSAELRAHQRNHTGEKPFKCDECPKAFSLHTSLKHHKMTHTGEKPFKCDQCGHGFIHRGQLNTHMRSHTGEKPYKCDQCGRGFTRSFDLGTHMRTHTGERPFKCSFCSNAFAKKHTLDNHIRIHTGEKPYKCEYCEKEFRQQGDMAKHRRKKHNV